MKPDIKQIRKEFFKLQDEVQGYGRKIDEKFEQLGILIEKLEGAEQEVKYEPGI